VLAVRLEIGSGVIAEERGDRVQWERLHLAAPARTVTHPWSRNGHRKLRVMGSQRLDLSTTVAYTWPTLCGLTGLLYVYDGMIRDLGLRFCSVCVRRSGGHHP